MSAAVSQSCAPIARSFADALRRAEDGPVRLYAADDDQAREFAGKLRTRLGQGWRERVLLEVAQHCSSCGAPILWAPTSEGKSMPLDLVPEQRVVIGARTGLAHVLDTYMPHWATCPTSEQHRRSKP